MSKFLPKFRQLCSHWHCINSQLNIGCYVCIKDISRRTFFCTSLLAWSAVSSRLQRPCRLTSQRPGLTWHQQLTYINVITMVVMWFLHGIVKLFVFILSWTDTYDICTYWWRSWLGRDIATSFSNVKYRRRRMLPTSADQTSVLNLESAVLSFFCFIFIFLRSSTMTATHNDHDGHNHDGHEPWWPRTMITKDITWWNLSNDVVNLAIS